MILVERKYVCMKILSGFTLSVIAGSVIRCAGDLTLDGSIYVYNGAENRNNSNPNVDPPMASSINFEDAHPGDAASAASTGWFHSNWDTTKALVKNGNGGYSIPEGSFLMDLRNLRIGGGSGAGPSSSSGGELSERKLF